MVTLTEGQKTALGSVIRWALMLIAAPLIAHKVINPTIAGVAIDDFIPQVIGVLMAGGVLGWSQIQKWIAGRREAVALALPPGSTPSDVTVTLKTLPGTTPIPPVLPPASTITAKENP